MITVHLILNAHLDPIWLWPWQAGLDAALATCRSACDRLDAHPDIFFTRGEAWLYDQVERVDPALFARIRKHVEAGRWEIIGGWWIQPDCNLPSSFALEHQIGLGKQYFMDRFGFFPRAGYNVDSFGHAATLPTLMRAAGQDRYIMMRPQPHEMKLPARLFRWRQTPTSPEVVTFRIAGAYTHWQASAETLNLSLTELPDGIAHTMYFLGIGDHGGGPTERLIAWCKQNKDAMPGCRLEFSTVQRFFDAVASQTERLPVVTGELQHHAVGCYSVHRPIKTGVRKAEHLLRQAEIALKHDPKSESTTAQNLEQGWKQVCFHHFHDTMGGTCLPSAYSQVDAQLGMAMAIADGVCQHSLRRQLVDLPDDQMQRIALFNASDTAFDDYVEFEPWVEWRGWQGNWPLRDQAGRCIPMQLLRPEAPSNGLTRFLFRVQTQPGQLQVVRMDRTSSAPSPVSGATADGDSLANEQGTSLHLGQAKEMRFAGRSLPLPEVHLLDDPSDTWSHDIDRYAEGPAVLPTWEAASIVGSGPLMASLVQPGRIGQSHLVAEYRVYAGKPIVELRLRVHWMVQRKVLKLVVPLPSAGVKRFDGIPGSDIERPMNGAERPLRDRSLVELADGDRLGIVCPDVFALDATAARVRLTLLRSPEMANHVPHQGFGTLGRHSDQGIHEFRFRFLCSPDVSGNDLDAQAMAMQRPLLIADLTRGMPPKDEM
jgi:alpha-mannosidase